MKFIEEVRRVQKAKPENEAERLKLLKERLLHAARSGQHIIKQRREDTDYQNEIHWLKQNGFKVSITNQRVKDDKYTAILISWADE